MNDKTILRCPACFGDINVGEIHDCMDKPTIFKHEHSYKVLKTEEFEDEIMFVYMTCICGSVIKVEPKTSINYE